MTQPEHDAVFIMSGDCYVQPLGSARTPLLHRDYGVPCGDSCALIRPVMSTSLLFGSK
jgi:hypothetical protein